MRGARARGTARRARAGDLEPQRRAFLIVCRLCCLLLRQARVVVDAVAVCIDEAEEAAESAESAEDAGGRCGVGCGCYYIADLHRRSRSQV